MVQVNVPVGYEVDEEGRLGLSCVQHLVWARDRAGASAETLCPITEETMRLVAAKLGEVITIKTCRRLLRRLVEAGVIERVGSYRQAYATGPVFKGYHVPLFRVFRAVYGSLRSTQRPVGTPTRVKRRKRRLSWYETFLGSVDGRPPPGLGKQAARRMKTLDDLHAPGSAAA